MCRILEVPFAKSNEVSKILPDSAHYVPIKDFLATSEELKDLYDTDPLLKEAIDMAIGMEGCIKSYGIHAAGVILADEPITDYVPLFSSKDMPVSQFDADTVDKIGYNKIDVLGIKTLSVLKQAFEYIKDRHGVVLTMETIPLDDAPTYNIFLNKNTAGIFQMEESLMTEYASRCKPKSLMEISNVISLVRPGPLGLEGCLDGYAKSCSGESPVGFPFPQYNYIFKDTYGYLIYQEQLSRLSIDMCGFTGPESDELRKACAR